MFAKAWNWNQTMRGTLMVVVAIAGLAAGSAVKAATVREMAPPDDDRVVGGETETAEDGPLAGPKAAQRRPSPPESEGEVRDRDEEAHRPPGRRRGGFRRHRGDFGEADRRGPRDYREGDGPPPDDGFRRESRRSGRPRNPEEKIRRVMEVLRKELPEWHERLSRLCEESPDRCHRAIRKLYPMIREYLSLKQRDPELARTVIEEFRLEHELRELGRAYQKAEDDPEEQARISTEIETRVRRQLEIRLQRREARLADLEQRLTREREKYEKEREGLDAKVEDRVNRIKSGQWHERFRRGHESRYPRGRSDDPAHRRFRHREDGEKPHSPERGHPGEH